MSGHRLQVRFEDFEGHRSVVVRWLPAGRPRAHAVFVPAFGDEMNQMRRMVRLAGEALAGRGVAGCTFDLLGTGDSSADFSEATVERWLSDCRMAIARTGAAIGSPLVLIGCRLGAALAAQASRQLELEVASVIGWAPVLQGRAQLSAMLRAANIARMQRPGAAGEDPKASWAAGRVAVLGGYPVSAALAAQIEALDAGAAPHATRSALFELRVPVGDGAVQPSEALVKRAAAWTAQGVPTTARAIAGAAFWNVADLVDVPELVDATVDAVEQAIGQGAPGALR